MQRLRQYAELCKVIGASYKLDPLILMAIIWQESSAVPWAVRYEPGFRHIYYPQKYADLTDSTLFIEERCQKTSWGLCQVMLATARWLGFESDPRELLEPIGSITYGAKYLSRLQNQYSSLREILSSYNGGSPRPKLDKYGHPEIDAYGNVIYQNQDYVDSVMANMQKIKLLGLLDG